MAKKKNIAEVVEVVKETFAEGDPIVDEIVAALEADDKVEEVLVDVNLPEGVTLADVTEEMINASMDKAFKNVIGDVVEVVDTAGQTRLFSIMTKMIADGYQVSDIKARIKVAAEKYEVVFGLDEFCKLKTTDEMIKFFMEKK